MSIAKPCRSVKFNHTHFQVKNLGGSFEPPEPPLATGLHCASEDNLFERMVSILNVQSVLKRSPSKRENRILVFHC